MLNKSRGFAALEVGDQPFIFVLAMCWTTEPNSVTADDDEVGAWHGGEVNDEGIQKLRDWAHQEGLIM